MCDVCAVGGGVCDVCAVGGGVCVMRVQWEVECGVKE